MTWSFMSWGTLITFINSIDNDAEFAVLLWAVINTYFLSSSSSSSGFSCIDITRVALLCGFIILARFISTSCKQALVKFWLFVIKNLRTTEALGRQNLQKNIILEEQPPRILNSSSVIPAHLQCAHSKQHSHWMQSPSTFLLHVIHNIDPPGLSFCFLLGRMLPTDLSRFLSLAIYWIGMWWRAGPEDIDNHKAALQMVITTFPRTVRVIEQ